jgi:hypothetical protein
MVAPFCFALMFSQKNHPVFEFVEDENNVKDYQHLIIN